MQDLFEQPDDAADNGALTFWAGCGDIGRNGLLVGYLLLYAYEGGDLTNRLIPITEDDAMAIVDRFRRDAGASG